MNCWRWSFSFTNLIVYQRKCSFANLSIARSESIDLLKNVSNSKMSKAAEPMPSLIKTSGTPADKDKMPEPQIMFHPKKMPIFECPYLDRSLFTSSLEGVQNSKCLTNASEDISCSVTKQSPEQEATHGNHLMVTLSTKFQSLFSHDYSYPTQLSKSYLKIVEQAAFLLRKKEISWLLYELESRDVNTDSDSKSYKCIFLDGPSGVGKSVTLLQFVNLIYEAGSHFIFYIPEAQSWIDGHFPFYPMDISTSGQPTSNTASPSQLYDQPELGQAFLRQILALNKSHIEHGGKLADITFSFSLNMKDRVSLESSSSPQILTISKAIEYGIIFPESATSIIRQLINHLNEQRHLPILFVVDQVNALFSKFGYRDEDRNVLSRKQMPLIDIITDFYSPFSTLKTDSLAIGAFSYFDNQLWQSELKNITKNHRRFLSRLEQSGNVSKKDIPSESWYQGYIIPTFRKDELLTLLKFYKSIGYIYEDFLEGIYLDKKFFMSGGNGFKLFESCSYDNIYYV